MALVRPVLPWQSISSTKGTIQAWGGGGMAPVSLVNVTCIPRQCLVLGQLDDCFLARDQGGEWGMALPDTPISSGSLWPLDGMGVWPSVWRLAPDVQFSKSLDLAAIDMTVVAVNPKLQIKSCKLGAKALPRNEETTGFALTTSFPQWLRFNLSTTNGLCSKCGDASDLGKGSHQPSWTSEFWQFKGWSWTVTAPLLNQTFRILPLCIKSIQGCQKCDRLHRDTRWICGLSYQSSNLSNVCYLLQKVVVHACSNTGFEQHKVVNYPANLQTT